MDITRDYLTSLIDDWNNQIRELRSRKYSQLGDKDDCITLDYACFICKKYRKQIGENQYVPADEMIQNLTKMNWEHYSFASKAYSGEDLNKALLVSKRESRDRVMLLERQAYYLEKAAELIITIIKEE